MSFFLNLIWDLRQSEGVFLCMRKQEKGFTSDYIKRITDQLTSAERGETSGVSKVFLRIARKSILFEPKT